MPQSAPAAVDRKLAAFLAADIVGYSAMVGANEDITVRDLKRHQAVLLPMIPAFAGRVVSTAGDGFMAEFASVVNAVNCAIALQQTMARLNSALETRRRMQYRVGVNLGDVIFDQSSVHGDGINIAARLEAVAEPGGICISGKAHDEISGKVEASFAYMGERTLKNIAQPIRAFGLGSGAIAALSDVTIPKPAPRRPVRRSQGLALAAALVDAFGLAGVAKWVKRDASTPSMATDPASRLSIVVLPLANTSNDANEDYFVDGITDNLTTDLSRIPGSFVIARNTAFTYKNKAVDVKQVGRELGVRYVLEGSVHLVAGQVSVNVQLIDGNIGASVWADRIDVKRTGLVNLENEITPGIARMLNVELINAEGRRALRASNPDAVDLTMRGWSILNGNFTRVALEQAINLFESALKLDPNYTEGLVGLGQALTWIGQSRWTEDINGVLRRATEVVDRALASVPNHANAHYVRGEVSRIKKEFPSAIEDYQAAIAIDHSFAAAYAGVGRTFNLVGRGEETFAQVDTAIRLSPRDPNLFLWYFIKCHACTHLAQDDKAIEWCLKSIAHGNYWIQYVDLASAYAWTGRIEEAKAAVAEILRLNPGYTVQKWANAGFSDHPKFLVEFQRIVEGLRKAGLPEG